MVNYSVYHNRSVTISIFSESRIRFSHNHVAYNAFQVERKEMRGLEVVVGFTLAALILYFFVGKAEESSKFIGALSEGYTRTVTTLQGR